MSSQFSGKLIHPATAGRLEAFSARPAHGLLLSGVKGSGKYDAARLLAAELLDLAPDKLNNYPYLFVVEREADKKEISIDAARQLISKLSLKVPGQLTINRIAIINEAGLLSTEAQNALLKLLEEPPAGSLIVLTAENGADLLPTVVSRLQKIAVLPVSLDQAVNHFQTDYKAGQIESAWRLSRGAARLMSEILADENAPIKEAVSTAKQILKMNRYERLIYFDGLSKNKEQFELSLDGLGRVLTALNRANVEAGRHNSAKNLLTARRIVANAQESLAKNANSKLVALNLVLSLPL